ncbi:MAG: DUF3006 domain-containing protein [Clostridia bacterium]|nr:DUF3006 domain-containing protein [Clostridia bacterium]
MTVIIDRWEGSHAVAEIEEGRFVEIPGALIPDAKEGDCIKIRIGEIGFDVVDSDGSYVYLSANGTKAALPLSVSGGASVGDKISLTIDENETQNRRNRIKSLMNSLFE